MKLKMVKVLSKVMYIYLDALLSDLKIHDKTHSHATKQDEPETCDILCISERSRQI
jgi:hypothetical protein